MIGEKRESKASGRPDSQSDRTYRTNAEIAGYIGSGPAVIPVLIHVVGEPEAPRIVVTPNTAKAKQGLDAVIWWAGANCGDWEVAFKEASPLNPPGPFSSAGPIGGEGVGDPGFYPYTIRARDLRTDEWVEVDPDVLMMPGKTY